MKINNAESVMQPKRSLRARGIGYDTGFSFDGVTRRPLGHTLVRRELQIIRDDLHCTAVRLFGNDLDQLEFAAHHAADLGLEVWFSPFPYQLGPEEMLNLLADGAERAERIRRRGAEVVFVTGAELSLFNSGFLPGDSLEERVGNLLRRQLETPQLLAGLPARINDFLAKAVAAVRERFGGKVTYASIPLEGVDWTPFDIVSMDGYRDAGNRDRFADDIKGLSRYGKPVAITEFGCCAYQGAADRGGMGWMIIDPAAVPPVLNGDYVRDEGEQVRYLTELLEVFSGAGVDTAFWFTFAGYQTPRHDDPRRDLDLASYGLVAILDDDGTDWRPKEAFHALAAAYGRAER